MKSKNKFINRNQLGYPLPDANKYIYIWGATRGERAPNYFNNKQLWPDYELRPRTQENEIRNHMEILDLKSILTSVYSTSSLSDPARQIG